METQIKPLSRRILSLALSLVLLVTMLAAIPVSAAKDHNHTPSIDFGSKMELAIKGECDYKIANEVLNIVNAERKKAGKKALAMDKTLMEYAMQRAAECSVYYSHTRPNGELCFTILEGEYTHFSAGENIAAGYPDATRVMNGWMNSPGHKTNILSDSFQSLGIGVFQVDGTYYWCQLFSGLKKKDTPTQKKPVTKTISFEAQSKLLNKLTIDQKKLTLKDGETATLKVYNKNTTFFDQEHLLDNSGLTFISSDTKIATVSQAGVVTPIGKGTTTITVKSKDGVKLFTVSITAACKKAHTKHDYAATTCTAPKTCKVCGATSGKAPGHKYTNACDKSCDTCGATRTIKHNFKAATCAKAKTCKVCGVTSGKAPGHKYTNACDTSCNTCKAVRTITHQYTTVTKKATATANGYTVKQCSGCKKETGKTTIYKASKISLSTTTYTYNGSAKKPSVVVKDAKGNKIASSNYTVTYASGRKNVGTYNVTIKFKGNYSGTKTLTFKINPVNTTVKATAAKKSLKLAIGKKTTQITGYQIQYSTSKSFKSYKTKTLTSYKTTSTTLSNLKAKTTYYVRVRTYKTVNGMKYYSGWSTIVSKKTT